MKKELLDFMNEYSKKSFAHKKYVDGNLIRETLEEHSYLSLRYFNYYNQNNMIKNIISKLYDETSLELLKLTLFLHDTGKKNPKFQTDNMNNKIEGANRIGDSNHSLLGAYIYISLMFKYYGKYFDIEKDSLYLLEIIDNGYIISRHHSDLNGNYNDFLDGLKSLEVNSWVINLLDEYKIPILSKEILFDDMTFLEYIESELSEFRASDSKAFEKQIYIKCRFTYSLLTNCDSLATREFLLGEDKKFKFYNKIDVDKYFSGNLYQSISDYANGKKEFEDNDINKIRSDIAIEVENNIKISNKDMFFLEAPCGAGKTNVGLLSACNLIKVNNNLNGIIYTSPFNAITDQNVDVFKEYFNDIQVINSTSIINTTTYDENDVESMVTDYQVNNNSFIATSHVHLFNILFGTRRSDLLGLTLLSNRVIILDEIQAYTPVVWKMMTEMFSSYAELLNIKFIIMSATLPNLSLLTQNIEIENLIKDRNLYFNHRLFKDRVKIKYIGKIKTLKDIIKNSDFYNGKKVLYEFITKKTANEFYELIKKEFSEKEIYLLDGDCNVVERKKIINRVKENIDVIVISTQVIEAGVDLDFDYGFKDTSLFDSEIQFLGRINRSCKNEGFAEFFDYDEKRIYKNDVRIESSIANPEILEAIKDNNSYKLYEKTIEMLNKFADKQNSRYSYSEFINDLSCLNYSKIYEKMELIKQTASIYIAHNLCIENVFTSNSNFIDIYNRIKDLTDKYCFEVVIKSGNNLIINGKNLYDLEEKVKKDKDLSYAVKFIYLKDIKLLKTYFTYVFYPNNNISYKNVVEQPLKNFYYTEDDSYIINNKINRSAFKENNFW